MVKSLDEEDTNPNEYFIGKSSSAQFKEVRRKIVDTATPSVGNTAKEPGVGGLLKSSCIVAEETNLSR
jgi:hypothetical protein